MSEYNLNDFYRGLFGYVAAPFPIGGVPDPKNLTPENKVQGLFNRKTMLGHDLRMPVKVRIAKEGEEWYQLPNEPMVRMSNAKEVKVTRLNRAGGKRGTVKEEIALDDYKLTISGIIYNEEADDYPEADVAQIRRIFEHPGPLEIECLKTRIMNVTLVVCQSLDWPTNTDVPFRMQAYSISLLSDEDFDLELV